MEIGEETMETVRDFLFYWAPKSLQMVTAAMKLKDTEDKGPNQRVRQREDALPHSSPHYSFMPRL